MKYETTLSVVMALSLVLVGVAMVYSARAVETDAMALLTRHGAFVAAGFLLMLVFARFDYHRFRDANVYRGIALVSIALLVLVLIPGIGYRVDGGMRWFRFGSVGFQPSELGKLALIILLAVKMTQTRYEIGSFWRGFFVHFVIAAIFAGLVLMERDLGGPAMLMGTAYFMFFAAGIRWYYLLGSLVPVGVAFAALIYTAPHRMSRMLAFIDPWEHRSTSGWQLIQSLAAFARGGFLGQGAGAGEQKLGYLPAAHTDFIFSVIGEEFGLVGTTIVVSFYVLLAVAGLRIAMNTPDYFGSLLATGITCMLALQAAFIMAVTTGMLPTKGLPLPFVSYGGTALVVMLAMVGILANIGAQAHQDNAPRRPVPAAAKAV